MIVGCIRIQMHNQEREKRQEGIGRSRKGRPGLFRSPGNDKSERGGVLVHRFEPQFKPFWQCDLSQTFEFLFKTYEPNGTVEIVNLVLLSLSVLHLMMYVSFLFTSYAEDEEREQLAKEISKDWSSGNSLYPLHFHLKPACFMFVNLF